MNNHNKGKREAGNTLAASLVTVAIILVLMVVLFKGSSVFGLGKSKAPERADKHGKTVLGRVRFEAKDDVCRSNLSQVRQALQIAQINNDDKYPDSLEETRLGADFYRCPIDHEPYDYDPATGKVSCPHPGHEKF